MGRLQKTPQMGAAFSFLSKTDAMEMCVFCNFQKLKVVCLLESLTLWFMLWDAGSLAFKGTSPWG